MRIVKVDDVQAEVPETDQEFADYICELLDIESTTEIECANGCVHSANEMIKGVLKMYRHEIIFRRGVHQ